ncbi:MAG: hypothetical protein LQ338_004766 [Usnochroma carphineum]|nr:MAG: hypothetical protein LQ338_004766 [Usnochroma carphineum]
MSQYHPLRIRRCLPSPVPSRTIFGFARPPARKEKPPDFDPGSKEMLGLSSALAKHERPPPRPALVKAFSAFVLDRHLRQSLSVDESQVGLLLMTLRYLQDTRTKEEGLGLSVDDMLYTMELLKVSKSKEPEELDSHIALARLLYAEVDRVGEMAGEDRGKALNSLIKILALKRKPQEALELLEENWEQDRFVIDPNQWKNVLLGFALVGDQERMFETIEAMEKHGVPFNSHAHQAVIAYYTKTSKDVEMMKKWYEIGIAKGIEPTRRTDLLVLSLCIQNNELEWGEPILRSFLDTKLQKTPNDIKVSWKLILQWAAAKGKRFEEVDQLLNVLVQKSQEEGINVRPDIDMINPLIKLAASKNDAYAAERYLALGLKRGLQPDYKTKLLQFSYRLDSSDLDGAKAIYDDLKDKDYEIFDSLAPIDKLLVALCSQTPIRHDIVSSLLDDIHERNIRLGPDAVSALTLYYLQRSELPDLIDLLNTHAYRFSTKQRTAIRSVFITYILNPSILTAKVWDAYNILRRTFPETPLATRTEIMTAFFGRGRSDMATHVFGHMRSRDMPADVRPTASTYVLCFEGIGKCGDAESLGLVYNMLKVDNTVEPDTGLYNSLMLAHLGCRDPGQALRFWDEIVRSREGPTERSFLIALRACEMSRGEEEGDGERRARDIWKRLKRLGVSVTREIYAAYVGALAGQGLFDECVELVGNAEREVGCKPDVLLLGTFHNALPVSQQDVMDRWASERYPAVWAEVKKLSKRRRQSDEFSGDGGVVYNIGRDVKA